MQHWNLDLAEHPSTQALRALEEALKQALETEHLADDASDLLVRIGLVQRYTTRQLLESDLMLVPATYLTQVSESITRVRSQVEAFASNRNVGHLNKANAECDQLLGIVGRTPKPESDNDILGLQTAVQQFHKTAADRVAELKDDVESGGSKVASLKDAIARLASSLDSLESRMDGVIDQHQKHFLDSQESRQRVFSDFAGEISESLSNALNEFKEKSLTIRSEQAASMAALEAEIQEGYDAFKDKAYKSLSEAMDEVNERRDHAKKIVGLIAGTGMAGGYQKDADEQRKAYYLWSVITVLGYAGLIGFAIALFLAAEENSSFSWPSTIARSITIIAFGLFAEYARRVAQHHRDSERKHRHKQLALESVNSFIEDLSDEEQIGIKRDMAEVMFIRQDPDTSANESSTSTTVNGLLEIISKFIDKQ